jgi:hypothetical protein
MLSDLTASRIDLHGLFVVRRNVEKGERRLVGRIDWVEDDVVHLSEHYADTDTVSASDVTLEGSKPSFARCLKTILGSRYVQFDRELDDHMAQLLDGPAMASMLDRMGEFLRGRSPIRLAPDLEATAGERFDLSNPEPPTRKIIDEFPPVEFCFDTARTKRDQYPWSGLERFGPFSRSCFLSARRSSCSSVRSRCRDQASNSSACSGTALRRCPAQSIRVASPKCSRWWRSNTTW